MWMMTVLEKVLSARFLHREVTVFHFHGVQLALSREKGTKLPYLEGEYLHCKGCFSAAGLSNGNLSEVEGPTGTPSLMKQVH